MKFFPMLMALLLMAALLPGQAYGQSFVDRVANDASTTVYKGAIAGKYKIKMVLTERTIMRKMEDGEIFAVGTLYTGYYLYLSQGKRIKISGDYDAQGIGGAEDYPEIDLYEVINDNHAGYFDGRFNDDDVYSGTWHSADDKHKYHFVLIPQYTFSPAKRHTGSKRRRLSAQGLEDKWPYLSAEDLRYGEQQVERMVKDRPEMLRYVKKGDAIWNYCVRQFAGESVGWRIHWNNTSPQPFPSDNEYDTDPQRGYIRLNPLDDDGKKASCEELWAWAVYELNNIQNYPAMDKIDDAAIEGKLTKKQYCIQVAYQEFLAYRKTAEVYQRIWLPLAKKKGLVTTRDLWDTEGETFPEWMSDYYDKHGNPIGDYPWCYGKDYDKLLEDEGG